MAPGSAADQVRVTSVETVHCGAGWRNYHFCKISTDEGIVGWSEFDEGFGSPGVSTVIDAVGSRLIGRPVGDHERICTELFAATRPGAGSVVGQGLGAIENALLDAKAKALGVPVYSLLGGKLRDKIRVYWSHCGTWRIAYHQFYGNRITDLAGVRALGEEVRDKGFTALKTNIFTMWTARSDRGLLASADRGTRSSTPSRSCCRASTMSSPPSGTEPATTWTFSST